MSPGPITAADMEAEFSKGLVSFVDEPAARDFGVCIQCGTCTASCPAAHAMDHPPRRIVRMASLGLWREIASGRSVWECLTCAACQARCPRGIDIPGGMLALRREFGRRMGLPESMVRLVSTLESSRNITGDPNDNKALWLDDLDERPPLVSEVAGTGVAVDAVYFVGCVASLFPAVYGIPRSVAGVLALAGLKFAVMGGDEWCCGFPLIGAGQAADRIELLVRHNVGAVKKSGATRLVTSCPSCFHTWKHAYEDIYGGSLGFEVIHTSQLFAELLDGRRLDLKQQETTVTYHDPCDLGRKCGVFDAPRRVLRGVPGVELREMRFHGEQARCCGGGGNLEMNDPGLSTDIAGGRLEQALETGAAVLVSSCQQCKRTLQGAARRGKAKIRVMDLAELLLRSATAE